MPLIIELDTSEQSYESLLYRANSYSREAIKNHLGRMFGPLAQA